MSTRQRPPQNGEFVKYFPHGDLSEPWCLMEVKEVSPIGACVLVGTRVTASMGAELVCKQWVHRVSASHWDRVGLPEGAKRREGAWEFHDVYARPFDLYVGQQNAKTQRDRQREVGKEEMDPQLFNALELLEEHGANVELIAEEVGLSVKELDAFPEFKAAFKEQKQADFRRKQGLELQTAKG